jgi:hypothetical protein
MTASPLILAQGSAPKGLQELFENLKTAMRPSGVGSPTVILILTLVGGIVALLLIITLIKSRKQAQHDTAGASRPMRLFNRALKKMGIGVVDRVLLRMIARKARVAQPAVMLFSPALLQRYASRWVESLRFSMVRDRIRARLRVVAVKAFD